MSVGMKKKLEKLKTANPFLSNTELVYRLLLDEIVDHRIKPGSKLNQEQLAEELDVSRTPVREALNTLEQEGFLSKGTQGYTVYIMKIGDYMAILDLRIAMETLGTRLACSRIRVSEAKEIEKILDVSQKLLDSAIGTAWNDDLEIINEKKAEEALYKLGQLDQKFHYTLVKCSRNPYLIKSYEDLMPKLHFFRYTALDANSCCNMVDRHRRIFEAIRMRDDELAVKRMEVHLRNTVTRAMRY